MTGRRALPSRPARRTRRGPFSRCRSAQPPRTASLLTLAIRRRHRGPSGPVGHGRRPPPPTLLTTHTPSGRPGLPAALPLLPNPRPTGAPVLRPPSARDTLTRGPLGHRRQTPSADTCSRHTVTQHALHTPRRQRGTLPTATPLRGSPSHLQRRHRRKRPMRRLFKRGKRHGVKSREPRGRSPGPRTSRTASCRGTARVTPTSPDRAVRACATRTTAPGFPRALGSNERMSAARVIAPSPPPGLGRLRGASPRRPENKPLRGMAFFVYCFVPRNRDSTRYWAFSRHQTSEKVLELKSWEGRQRSPARSSRTRLSGRTTLSSNPPQHQRF